MGFLERTAAEKLESVGLQGTEAGQGACPLRPLPRPTQYPKMSQPVETIRPTDCSPVPEWPVPDRGYFALDKDLGDCFLPLPPKSILFNLNYGWHIFETGGNLKTRWCS